MKQAGTVVGCAFYEVVCSYLLVSIIIDVSYISMNICTNLSAGYPGNIKTFWEWRAES